MEDQIRAEKNNEDFRKAGLPEKPIPDVTYHNYSYKKPTGFFSRGKTIYNVNNMDDNTLARTTLGRKTPNEEALTQVKNYRKVMDLRGEYAIGGPVKNVKYEGKQTLLGSDYEKNKVEEKQYGKTAYYSV